jgi:hypothetical protein
LGLTVELMGELRRLYTEEDNYFNLPSWATEVQLGLSSSTQKEIYIQNFGLKPSCKQAGLRSNLEMEG